MKRDPVIFKHLIWYLENELKIPCYPLTLTGDPHLGTVHKLNDFRKELLHWELDVPILLDLIALFKSEPKGLSPSALGKWKEMGPVDLAQLVWSYQIMVDKNKPIVYKPDYGEVSSYYGQVNKKGEPEGVGRLIFDGNIYEGVLK